MNFTYYGENNFEKEFLSLNILVKEVVVVCFYKLHDLVTLFEHDGFLWISFINMIISLKKSLQVIWLNLMREISLKINY